MTRRRPLWWLILTTVLSCLSLALWLWHIAHGQDGIQSVAIGDMAQQIRINTDHIAALTTRVNAMEDAHRYITYLLLGNMAAALGALSTYAVTHQARRRDD